MRSTNEDAYVVRVAAEQAAALLKMTKSAVLKAAQRGRLPAVRHGRRVRFRRRDLLQVNGKSV